MDRSNDIFRIIGNLETMVNNIIESRKNCGVEKMRMINGIKKDLTKTKKLAIVGVVLGSLGMFIHFTNAGEDDLFYILLKKIIGLF